MTAVNQLLEQLQTHFGDTLIESTLALGQITLVVSPSHLKSVALALRDHPQFACEMLIDVCGVDYQTYGQAEWDVEEVSSEGFSRGVHPLAKEQSSGPFPHRFAVVYHLLSISLNHRIRLKTFLPSEPPMVPSVNDIWNSANWFEREAFDLFGIIFEGHTDLRRILTDYGFIGHPFRKDFPLSGEVEMRYDATLGRVVYEPVSIEPRVLVPRVNRVDNRYTESQKKA